MPTAPNSFSVNMKLMTFIVVYRCIGRELILYMYMYIYIYIYIAKLSLERERVVSYI